MTEQQAPQAGAVDLVGRKVKLTGHGYVQYGLGGLIRTVVKDDSLDDGTVGCATRYGQAWVWLNEPENEYAGVLLPERERIVVYSYAVPDSHGGFFWAPATPENLTAALNMAHDGGREPGERGAIVELSIAGYGPSEDERQQITDYIDGELQDAIAYGLVGKIIEKY